MARNNNKMTRRKKIEPAVLSMFFEMTLTGDNVLDDVTIDLSQCASLMNRRFYRQGLNWAVAGFKILSPTGVTGSVAVKKLPNTWTMSNAWEKGFRAWQKMNNEALDEAPSVKPKFLDFKVYADVTHHQAGFTGNLLPGVFNPTFVAATPGEWESSKYVIPQPGGATNSREVVATGASYPGASPVTTLDAVSLIEGYAASRGLPDVLDPNAPADAADVTGAAAENWLAGIFDEGTTQDDRVLDDMITENNIAPYPFENDGTHVDTMYPGGANQLVGLETHDLEFITGTTIGGTTHLKGGNFPCGLIRITGQKDTAVASAITIQVDLVPGDHRGYLCEPMTEM